MPNVAIEVDVAGTTATVETSGPTEAIEIGSSNPSTIRFTGVQSVAGNTTIVVTDVDLVWVQQAVNAPVITLSSAAPPSGELKGVLLRIQNGASTVYTSATLANVTRFDGANVQPAVPQVTSGYTDMFCTTADGTSWYVTDGVILVAVPVAVSTANSEGTSSSLSRADHVHAERTAVTLNARTGSYTLVLTDAGKHIQMNVAGANTLTVPPNSSVAFATGTVIDGQQYGAGQTTITPGSGVTLRAAGGGLKTRLQYSPFQLLKLGTNEWSVSGDLTA